MGLGFLVFLGALISILGLALNWPTAFVYTFVGIWAASTAIQAYEHGTITKVKK